MDYAPAKPGWSASLDYSLGVSPISLTLENFRITLMLDVAGFARIQQGSEIL